ncbi:MAG: hypothetical protein EBZ48_06495, partial [Proteobacteria bacterium]|nr:hypothetical protein [Pseudomonadota bacterium]
VRRSQKEVRAPIAGAPQAWRAPDLEVLALPANGRAREAVIATSRAPLAGGDGAGKLDPAGPAP